MARATRTCPTPTVVQVASYRRRAMGSGRRFRRRNRRRRGGVHADPRRHRRGRRRGGGLRRCQQDHQGPTPCPPLTHPDLAPPPRTDWKRRTRSPTSTSPVPHTDWSGRRHSAGPRLRPSDRMGAARTTGPCACNCRPIGRPRADVPRTVSCDVIDVLGALVLTRLPCKEEAGLMTDSLPTAHQRTA